MRERLSQLILEMESQLGTRDMVEMILDALLDTIEDFNTKDDKKFCNQFDDAVKDIKNTRPRIGLLIEDFHDIWNEIQKEEHCKKHEKNACAKCEDLKKAIKRKVKELKKKNREDMKLINKNTEKEIKKGDTILLHTHSHTVIDTLKAARRKKRFSCIVAEQQYEKTMALIRELHKSKIPFKVVPEHMLSHIEKEVDKVFIGAVTLNSFHSVVSTPGTMAVVSEFKGKAPIYLLMGTRKCSFWKAKEHHHSRKEQELKTHCDRPIKYNRIKFSHDRVPLEMFDSVITEKGKMTASQMLDFYKKEHRKRSKWRKAFF
ncbi:MAG: hypothetical protein ABII07_01855 [Patescibacteria group bacterium]|nr:translation initiation factor eIF-2B [Patescibacteria group bacterium]